MKLTNKTIEFQLEIEIPADWLIVSQRIWNDALTLLLWRQHYTRLQSCLQVELTDEPEDFCKFDLTHPVAIEKIKQGDQYYLHCWIGRDRRIDRTKSWDKDNIEFVPQVRLVPKQWLQEPPIKNSSHFELNKQFTAKIGYDVGSMPSGLRQALLGNLAQAWQRYGKGQLGKPRYKGVKNPITSLSYDGFRHFCSLYPDGSVKLLGMPSTYVHGIKDRLLPLIERTRKYLLENPTDRVLERAQKTNLEEASSFYSIPGSYTIINRPDGTYLQISGEFATSCPTESNSKTEVFVGGRNLYQAGEVTIAPFDTSKIERRIQNLQRQLAKKTFQSANWQKLKDKIAALQRRQRMMKRRHQQYHAQWLTDRYGEIVITKLPPEVDLCPAVRPDHEGGYLPNGASVISENNLRVAKLATGQFIDIIEQQGEARGRQITVKSDKLINSQDTPVSDSNSPKDESLHGQLISDDQRIRGKIKSTPKSQTREPRKRNRRRERAIG